MQSRRICGLAVANVEFGRLAFPPTDVFWNWLIFAATKPGRPIKKETTQIQPIIQRIVEGLERGRSGYLIAKYLYIKKIGKKMNF